jgi:hypothetical protein
VASLLHINKSEADETMLVNQIGVWIFNLFITFVNTVWWNALGAFLGIAIIIICILKVHEINRNQREFNARKAVYQIFWKVMK